METNRNGKNAETKRARNLIKTNTEMAAEINGIVNENAKETETDTTRKRNWNEQKQKNERVH